MEIYLQEQRRTNAGIIIAGIVLVGAGIGLGYYLYTKTFKPMPEIIQGSVRATVSEGVSALVRNAGKRAGYFKLQALVLPAGCPVQGISGYGKNNNWEQVRAACPYPETWWVAAPAGQGWQKVEPGQSAPLVAPWPSWASPSQVPTGNRNLYINIAVSTEGTSETRIEEAEVYYWVPVVIS